MNSIVRNILTAKTGGPSINTQSAEIYIIKFGALKMGTFLKKHGIN